MAKSTSTKLDARARTPGSSRETRRLRRSGRVPGVIYGRGATPVPFDADERDLRHALAGVGAVLDLSLDGATTEPAVLKDLQRHPVRGHVMHVDLFRVDLDKPIQAMVSVTLVGHDDAPGVKDGGVLEHVTRELNVEALPTGIPETIEVDVSAMAINDTILLAAITAPEGVTLLDDPDETMLVTLTPPRLRDEGDEDEIGAETEVVGEEAGGDADE